MKQALRFLAIVIVVVAASGTVALRVHATDKIECSQAWPAPFWDCKFGECNGVAIDDCELRCSTNPPEVKTCKKDTVEVEYNQFPRKEDTITDRGAMGNRGFGASPSSFSHEATVSTRPYDRFHS